MDLGIFDILAGLWPRPVSIARSVWPEKRRMNMWFCYAAMVLTVIGTVGETIIAMYLYGVNVTGWPEAIQWATPICHVVFMFAQGYSSLIMWKLARKHKEKLQKPETVEKDTEASSADRQNSISTERPSSESPGRY